MEHKTFWGIIQKSKDMSNDKQDKQLELLKKELNRYDKEKLIAFEKIFTKLYIKAYTHDLWGVAYIIDGCGDDQFDYFRAWLISNGKDFYYKVLDDPDSIAEIEFRIDRKDGIKFESFAYAARKVYEEKYSEEMPLEMEHPANPEGEDWENDDELKDRFPKTWQRFEVNKGATHQSNTESRRGEP